MQNEWYLIVYFRKLLCETNNEKFGLRKAKSNKSVINTDIKLTPELQQLHSDTKQPGENCLRYYTGIQRMACLWSRTSETTESSLMIQICSHVSYLKHCHLN